MKETRLFIGGPFDAKYKSIETKSWENKHTPYEVPYDPNSPPPYSPSTGSVSYEKIVEVHKYYAYQLWYDGKLQHILMRHDSIEDRDVMSTILQGYVKDCLHEL